jgi:hypothetical protein
MKVCAREGCTNEFEPKRKDHNYCSDKCYRKTWNEKKANSAGIVIYVPGVCSLPGCENGVQSKRHNTKRFCTRQHSQIFYRRGYTLKTRCIACGEIIEDKDSRALYCSDECLLASWNHCSIEGCTNLAESTHGLYCAGHLTRLKRHGDFGSGPIGNTGEGNHMWKGNDASYTAAHYRVKRAKGRAAEYRCVVCGKKAAHWAYNHGDPNQIQSELGPYSPNPDFYLPMCVKCHKKFDTEFESWEIAMAWINGEYHDDDAGEFLAQMVSF